MTQTETEYNTQSEFTSMIHQLIADVKDFKERDTQYSNKYQNNNRGGSNFRNSYRGNRTNYHSQSNRSNYPNQGNKSNYQNQRQRCNYPTQGQGSNYQNSLYGK